MRDDASELAWVAIVTGVAEVRRSPRLQSLWGGYGEIYRVYFADRTAIVKSVTPAPEAIADRGRASHDRKCRSYDVETAWYRSFASRCDDVCRMPRLLASDVSGHRWLFLLEDLDAAGFGLRWRRLEREHEHEHERIDACLGWLARLHGRFLGAAPVGLWPAGTYWHLATRAEELAALEDDALRAGAPVLDRLLRACPFQTIVHGDAKVANFCFSSGPAGPVAAVDYQYVGGGCGVQDVAYFLISCSDAGAEALDARHLDRYFAHLREAVKREAVAIDGGELERAWRALYPIACADFYRFYAGWAKHHWRHDAVGQQIVRDVLGRLGGG